MYLKSKIQHNVGSSASAMYANNMHVLKHPHVSLNHIFELFDSLIKPILTYGCAVWVAGSLTIMTLKHTTTTGAPNRGGGWGGRNPPEFWRGGGGVEQLSTPPDFEKNFIRGGWLPLN